MSSAAADPEEIRARVVVLGAHHADAADEWARPELEAFHLPSPSHQPSSDGFLAQDGEAEQSTPPAAAGTPAPPPPPPPPPLETAEQPASNARPSSNNDAKKPTPPAALRDLFRFADGLDCVLMLVGTLGALVHGCSLPVFLRFFADLVDSFGSHADDPDTMVRLVVKYAFYFLVVGAAIWASSWAGNC
jgi:ATP-binding cassette subfamily B (MDR/TAP) protein 1